jgi:hypothetical protein
MGISVSYASVLLLDPTGEKDRERKRKYLKRCKTCGELTHGEFCAKHAGKGHANKRRKWTEEVIIEAIQEWESIYGRLPTGKDWARARRDGLPEWVPTTRHVYTVFGKGGWNKAIAAAGFTPRPPQFPEWVVQEQSNMPHRPMSADAREKMSEERRALYAEDPENRMFTGLKEGWDLSLQRQERSQRRWAAKQAARDNRN